MLLQFRGADIAHGITQRLSLLPRRPRHNALLVLPNELASRVVEPRCCMAVAASVVVDTNELKRVHELYVGRGGGSDENQMTQRLPPPRAFVSFHLLLSHLTSAAPLLEPIDLMNKSKLHVRRSRAVLHVLVNVRRRVVALHLLNRQLCVAGIRCFRGTETRRALTVLHGLGSHLAHTGGHFRERSFQGPRPRG